MSAFAVVHKDDLKVYTALLSLLELKWGEYETAISSNILLRGCLENWSGNVIVHSSSLNAHTHTWAKQEVCNWGTALQHSGVMIWRSVPQKGLNHR